MKIISNLMLSLYLFLYRLYGRVILKLRDKHFIFIYSSAYIKANLLFPEATLNENSKLAKLVAFELLGGKSPDTESRDEEKKRAELYKNRCSDESVTGALANYFLLESFYFSYGNEDAHNEALKEKEDQALAKAKSYKDTVVPISYKDANSIDKKIKKRLKEQKKSIRKISSSKIEREKSKTIKLIKITATTVFLFSSMFSGLFLIGGFLYNKFLLGFLGINTSDFFDISDYIASSVDITFPVLASIISGVMVAGSRISGTVSEDIIANQFDKKTKNRNVWFYIFVAFCAAGFVIHFVHGEVHLILLCAPIFMILEYVLFDFLKIDSHIENKLSFRAVILILLAFVMGLGVTIFDTVKKVKNGSYQSPYIVSFKKEYKAYADHDFFLANSQYVFLLDKETKAIVVIPKTGIKAIQTRKEL